MQIDFHNKLDGKEKLLLIPVFKGQKSYPAFLDKWLKQRVEFKEFSAKCTETLLFYALEKNMPEQVLILGLGKKDKLTSRKVRRAFAKGVKIIRNVPKKDHLHILLSKELKSYFQALGEGAEMGNFLLDVFKSGKNKLSSEDKTLKKCTFVGELDAKGKNDLKRGVLIAEIVNEVRNYVNAPHNVMDAAYYASEAKRIAKENGYKCTVIEKKELEKMGMGALLGVNRGSEIGAKLVVLEYLPNGKKEKPIAIVGKGVTFDSGGLNLKPDSAMEGMKMDMAGAGVVLGVFALLKKLNIKKNVIGITPLTDNAVDAKSTRPNDILTSYSGKTIEVLNTDAEGRLILADAISYAVKDCKARQIIDLATLTGACMVALGTEYAGLFSNDKGLVEKLISAGKKSDEALWQLPIHKFHRESMKGKISDLANISGRRYAGASTAAAFLENFVEKVSWAHLDIAGVAKPDFVKEYEHENSASGFGVRLLIEYLSK